MPKIVSLFGAVVFILMFHVDRGLARTHHDAPAQVCNDAGCNPVPHGCNAVTGQTATGTPMDVVVCPMRKRNS